MTTVKRHPVITTVLLTIGVLALTANNLAGLGSTRYRPLVIKSGSMYPALEVNSLCLMEYCSVEDVEVGDIITYFSPVWQELVTHRVVEKGEDWVTTKGDANSVSDGVCVIDGMLIGKVVLVSNVVAPLISVFMRDGVFDIGMACTAFLVSSLLFVWLIVAMYWAFNACWDLIMVYTHHAYTRKLAEQLDQLTPLHDKVINAAMLLHSSKLTLLQRARLYDLLKSYVEDMQDTDEIISRMGKL